MVRVPYPSELHVTIDTREKLPVLFPQVLDWYPNRNTKKRIKIITEKATLDKGDYAPSRWTNLVAIERKGAMREVQTNITAEYERFMRALDRLATVQNPYLICDFGINEAARTTKYVPNPSMVVDTLIRECDKRSITLIWFGPCKSNASRHRLGDYLCRLMLNAIQKEFH